MDQAEVERLRRAVVQRIRHDWRWLWAYTLRPVLVDPVQHRAGPA